MNLQPLTTDGLLTLLVGAIAFLVYWLTKRYEKRSAATIIVMDIRHAEEVVRSILEKGVVDKNMKVILEENNWSKYKHLFASDLSSDDFMAFNRFFEACSEIADARERMVDVFYGGIKSKAELIQQKLYDIDDLLSEKGKEKREELINIFNKEDFLFDPNEPKIRIYRSLQLMGRLSNTIAFEKMKKRTRFR